MFSTRNSLYVGALIAAGTMLAGCAQTQGQRSPWAGISSAQQQPAHDNSYQGGYVDSKVDRQVSRQQSHIDGRVNREADQAVDSVMDRALDSIFD